MGKIIIKGDTTYKVEYVKPNYFLYRQIGSWWWKEWHRIYYTSNKMKFKNQIHRYFLSGE